jgi:hypothetical protein
MPERHDVINYIISAYKLQNPNYLEIGVQAGNTFRNVKSINKDGVDPCIYGKNQYINYEMLSDTFFSQNISKKYDIIFIDGLHTAYQVSKDIYNSLNHLNPGGFIVLDDIYPHSEHEQHSFKLFYEGPQTGDVWKAVYNVFDSLNEMSDKVYFFKTTMRGNLVFKIKADNTANIIIDNTIPKCNEDGLCRCGNCEWNKYQYSSDFNTYYKLLSNYESKI